MKLKLSYRIRKLGSNFYLIGENRCFEINEITKDILQLYNCDSSKSDVIAELSKQYSEIKEDEIIDLIDNLIKEGIIVWMMTLRKEW